MKLQIFLPVYPHSITRKWGEYVEDPNNPGHSIYEPLGFKLHNGIDIPLANGQIISAPFDCETIRTGTKENGKWQPNGGGIFVGLLSKNVYDFNDGKKTKVLVDFLHCKETVAQEGQAVPVGDVCAYGDNTGFTTGPHTHAQFRRVSYENRVLIDIDRNEANNSFDPVPYLVPIYAYNWKTLRVIQMQLFQLFGLYKSRIT